MNIISSAEPDINEILEEEHTLLADLCPQDVQLFIDLFVKYWPKNQCWVRERFDRSWYQPKSRRTRKGTEERLPLNIHGEQIMRDFVEKHLDLERWQNHYHLQRIRAMTAGMSPPEATRYSLSKWDEVGNWPQKFFVFGLLAPKYTALSCLDADNKPTGGRKDDNIVGWYRLWKNALLMPVLKCDLPFLKRLKKIHRAFPHRIWCLSSHGLGFHIWTKHQRRFSTEELVAFHARKLASLDISTADVEPHPNFARCLRRPFGFGYQTVTPQGLFTDWREQLHYFHSFKGVSPRFETIFEVYKRQLIHQWVNWVNHDNQDREKLMPLLRELRQAQTWMENGADPDDKLIVPVSQPAHEQQGEAGASDATPPLLSRPIYICVSGSRKRQITQTSHLDIKGICQAHEWVEHLVRWASEGLPEAGSLFDVTKELAEWLLWVELFDIPPEKRKTRTTNILFQYAVEKHNGHCTRLPFNLEQVKAQIARIVTIKLAEGDKPIWKDLRQKRSSGQYKTVIYLEPLLLGKMPERHRDRISLSALDQPLPVSVQEKIRAVAGRNKLLPFATRFLNYLAQRGGTRRVSQAKLCQFLGYKNPTRLQAYKRILVRAGVLDFEDSIVIDEEGHTMRAGGYKIGHSSKTYRLLVMTEFSAAEQTG